MRVLLLAIFKSKIFFNNLFMFLSLNGGSKKIKLIFSLSIFSLKISYALISLMTESLSISNSLMFFFKPFREGF